MKLFVNNEQSKQEAIEAINAIDTSSVHTVEIKKKRGKRTINQNSLYWMYMTCIEQETGNDKDNLHDHFRVKWLGYETIEVLGECSERLVSTASLDTNKFKQYLDKIQI